MRDRIFIYTGLCLFLALAAFPFSYNLAAGRNSRGPEVKLPEREKRCVEPVDYMRRSHMKLLMKWREDRVRNDIRSYKASDGKLYKASLTGTCLAQCHGSKSEFCDRCHSYSGVQGPYCADCHLDAPKTQRSGL
jgi:hypothetical protein